MMSNALAEDRIVELDRKLDFIVEELARLKRLRQSAEDLASETWLQVVRGLKAFRGDEAGFRSWLFTIARHKAHDWHRQQGRRPTASLNDEAAAAIPGSDDTEESAISARGMQDAMKMIRSLPPDLASPNEPQTVGLVKSGTSRERCRRL